MKSKNITLKRLKEQIAWYDKKSGTNKLWFYITKISEFIILASVIYATGLNWIGQLGVLLIVIEGIRSVFNFHQNWITYRSTCETLKHEKYLFSAGAGPYKGRRDSLKLLAERIEDIVSQEHIRWVIENKKIKTKK